MAQVPRSLSLTEILGAVGAARLPYFRAWRFAPDFIAAVLLNNRDGIKALAIEAQRTDVTIDVDGVPTTQRAMNVQDRDAIVALCDAQDTVSPPVSAGVWSVSSKAVVKDPDGNLTIRVVFSATNGSPDVTFAFKGPRLNRATFDEQVANFIGQLDARDVNAAAIEAA